MWTKQLQTLLLSASLALLAGSASQCVPLYCTAGVLCDSGGSEAPLLLLPSLGGGAINSGLEPESGPVTSPGDWIFYTTNTGSAGIDAGQGNTAPALRMATGAGDGSPNGGKVFLYNTAYNGTRLDALTTFSYDVYMEQSTSVWTIPYLNIFLDLDGNGSFDATDVMLVYSRDASQNKDTLGQDMLMTTWQTWDPLNQGYWFTRQNGVWNWTPRTTATILATYGSGQIVDPYSIAGTPVGGLQFVVGSSSGGLWTNMTALLDNLRLGVSGVATTHGF
ncbi:MAG: hypothetical protein NXI24_24235 [bacterium]|nr:hypothetical protein [bacterium]